MLDGEDESLEARFDSKLAQKIDHVGVNRLATDVKLLCDLLVAQTLGESCEHLALPRSQASQGRLGGLRLSPVLFGEPQQTHQFRRIDDWLTGAETSHRGNDLGQRRALLKNPRCTGRDRLCQVVAIGGRGEDQDLDERPEFTQVPDQIDAVAVRQVQLGDRDVGRSPRKTNPRLGDRSYQSDNRDVRLPLEGNSEGIAEDCLILDEENTDGVVTHADQRSRASFAVCR